MATPRDVRKFVLDVKEKGRAALSDHDFEQLCQFALFNLPMPCPVRGKKCQFCGWKIGCAAKMCKNCGKSAVKRPMLAPPVADGENDCNGACGQDLTGREYHQLTCGHKFCAGCLRGRISRGFRTCCLCSRVPIDDSLLEKYKPIV